MLGLTPGEPVKYSEAAKTWFPPHGPPLHLSVEFQKDGKTVTYPANKLIRAVKTKEVMHSFTWIFAGSRVLEDGTYGADPTGYVVSICNFDLCLIDVPSLVSSANETLEWERNPDLMPATGTPVTLIIEPAGAAEIPATNPSNTRLTTVVKISDQNKADLDGQPISPDQLTAELKKMKDGSAPLTARVATAPGADAAFVKQITDAITAAGVNIDTVKTDSSGDHLSDVKIDQAKVDRLRDRWNKAVGPHGAALREAAQAQYEVITELRREQQRLIDEADRVQRTIDELEKQYQDMTTPRPEDMAPATQP
jgi:biopolymer transport protein ExbD